MKGLRVFLKARRSRSVKELLGNDMDSYALTGAIETFIREFTQIHEVEEMGSLTLEGEKHSLKRDMDSMGGVRPSVHYQPTGHPIAVGRRVGEPTSRGERTGVLGQSAADPAEAGFADAAPAE